MLFSFMLLANGNKYQGGLPDDENGDDSSVQGAGSYYESRKEKSPSGPVVIYALPADDYMKHKNDSEPIYFKLRSKLMDKGAYNKDIFDTLDYYKSDFESIPTLWPVQGVISSRYGTRIDPITQKQGIHKGLDIYVPEGTAVKASGSGMIKLSGWQFGYGRVVYIDHGNGFSTRYAHLSINFVYAGEMVRRGRQIGNVGSSGRATGPHLHYEVRWRGGPMDPQLFLIDKQ